MNLEEFIPLEKSWLIRMGVLDIINGRRQIIDVLEAQPAGSLGTDLEALLRAARLWGKGAVINIGESGTLYRFLLFANWTFDMGITFEVEGTLRTRQLTTDKSVVSLSVDELLRLDANTSQWASASVLFADAKRPAGDLPYHLAMTFDAKKHWLKRVGCGADWSPRKDSTIARQARAYAGYLEIGQIDFKPMQAEDYCFARAFGLMSAGEGEVRWPSLRQHESDRIAEMERLLAADIIDSHDHRVVQALAMLGVEQLRFSDPTCVAKSWPQFWKYLDVVRAGI